MFTHKPAHTTTANRVFFTIKYNKNMDEIQVENERERVPIEFHILVAIIMELPQNRSFFCSTLIRSAMRWFKQGRQWLFWRVTFEVELKKIKINGCWHLFAKVCFSLSVAKQTKEEEQKKNNCMKLHVSMLRDTENSDCMNSE